MEPDTSVGHITLYNMAGVNRLIFLSPISDLTRVST